MKKNVVVVSDISNLDKLKKCWQIGEKENYDPDKDGYNSDGSDFCSEMGNIEVGFCILDKGFEDMDSFNSLELKCYPHSYKDILIIEKIVECLNKHIKEII